MRYKNFVLVKVNNLSILFLIKCHLVGIAKEGNILHGYFVSNHDSVFELSLNDADHSKFAFNAVEVNHFYSPLQDVTIINLYALLDKHLKVLLLGSRNSS